MYCFVTLLFSLEPSCIKQWLLVCKVDYIIQIVQKLYLLKNHTYFPCPPLMVIGMTPTPNCEVKVCVGSFIELHLINILDIYEGRYKLNILAFKTSCIFMNSQ